MYLIINEIALFPSDTFSTICTQLYGLESFIGNITSFTLEGASHLHRIAGLG